MRSVIVVDTSIFDLETVLLVCRLFSDSFNFDVKRSGDNLEVSYIGIDDSKIPQNFEEVFNSALLEQKVRGIIDKKCSGMRDKIVEMAFSHFR
ncbi:MAG: hypothetical protein LBU04_06720 [Christensenellaceae bacterium]|nr:hypothetical protein [Christensenellaceae bacterium]